MNENNLSSGNQENKEYSDYGRIDLTKEDIEPVKSVPVSPSESYNDVYSEELPVPTERIDLTKEDIPVVINNNVQYNSQISETNDYNVKEGVSQVYIPEPQKNTLPKKVKRTIFIIFLALILLAAGFLYYVNKPKQLFLNGIYDMYVKINDEYYNPINNYLNKNNDSPISVSNKINFMVETNDDNYLEKVKLFNGLEINLDVEKDSENEIFLSNFELFSNDESIINTSIYGKKNEAYFGIKDIFSKYIKFSDYESKISRINEQNLEEAYKEIKKIYLSELKDKDFTKINEQLTVDGKMTDVKKITLSLNNERFKELQDSVNNKILSDEKLTNLLCEILTISEKEFKEKLNELKNASVTNQLEVGVYLNEKEPVKIDFIIDEASFILVESNKYLDVTYKYDNNIIYSLTKENENLYMKLDDIVIEIRKSSENENDLIIKTRNNVIKGTLKYSEKEISNKEVIKNLIISMNIDNKTSFIINNENTTKIIEKVNIPDVTNYVDSKNLTDEEINSILEKIINKLVPLLENIFSETSADDNFSDTIN